MTLSNIEQSIHGNNNTQNIDLHYHSTLVTGISYEDFDIILDILIYYKNKNTPRHTENMFYVELEKKNKANNLSYDYFHNYITKESLPHFKQIQDFLLDPRNDKYNEAYFSVSKEIKYYIGENREKYKTFESFFTDIYTDINKNIPSLKRVRKEFIRVLLHYMYCTCDIGVAHE